MKASETHLREALCRITEIREQMVRTAVFRGFRALPVALTGLLAIAGAIAQGGLVPDPAEDVRGWLKLWIGIAVLCVLATGAEILVRYVRGGPGLARVRTRLAAGQFAPCLLAGAALTWVLARSAPDTLWLLPGLWSLLFGLGILATRPVLPRPFTVVGLLYVAAGFVVIVAARGESAFSPLAMGLPFGVGQIASAVILFWTLERRDGSESRP